MLELKIGMDYKSRDGSKVQNLESNGRDDYPFKAKVNGAYIVFSSDGKFFKGHSNNHPKDIVSIWDEPETPSSAKGVKYDSGKIIAGVIFEDFPRALIGLCEVATFGAEKYSRNDWQHVDDAHRRYSDAMVRHMLAKGSGEINDPETGLPHVFHIAWNALAIAELEAKEKVNV